MLIYATTAEVNDWLQDEAPANVDQLIRSASLLVRHATLTARYTVDPAGKPDDPDVLAAFRDATCAQVASWVTLGIDPAGGGIDGTPPVQSSKILNGDITYDTSAAASVTAQNARQTASRTLCTDAAMILSTAGLLDDPVTVYG